MQVPAGRVDFSINNNRYIIDYRVGKSNIITFNKQRVVTAVHFIHYTIVLNHKSDDFQYLMIFNI